MGNKILQALTACSLFDGIQPDEYERALSLLGAVTKSYDDGSLLLALGEKTHCVGVILSGRVRIDFYDAAGNASTITRLGCGGAIAGAIACSEDPSLVQVASDGPSEVVWLDVSQMMSYASMSKSPYAGRIMANLLRLLARKNMLLNRKMQMLAQKRLRDRIKLYLVSCQNAQTMSGTGAVNNLELSDLEMTRTGLASYLSVDRSALSRELSRMKDEGLIRLDGNRIQVLDKKFLRG